MDLREMGKRAAAAKYQLQGLTTEEKNRALEHAAEALTEHTREILTANARDLDRGRENGMHQGLLDRLKLNQVRIAAMAQGLKQVAALPDPVGECLESFDRPNGLHIEKHRVPLGVIGIIYESRPNVTADAFALCFKAGNAVILKGGSDALASNMAIAHVLQQARFS